LGLEREHLRLRRMELPEAKGTYVLIAFAGQMKRLEIGRLGTFAIVPGFYAYVGSAFGSGGLRARIGHHLESTTAPHWHIDYLFRVPQAAPDRTRPTPSNRVEPGKPPLDRKKPRHVAPGRAEMGRVVS